MDGTHSANGRISQSERGFMSGHSKWSNIKNKKAATDARRSKEFTNISKMIMHAVKKSGITDPDDNPSLRLALDKARAVNMPSTNIQRAIDRASGKGEAGVTLEEILYEGYGPHGVGILILVHTDNKQRTGAEIRSMFSRAGGSLAGPGAAQYLFTLAEGEYEVNIPIQLAQSDYDQVMELITEIEEHDDVDAVWHNAVLST